MIFAMMLSAVAAQGLPPHRPGMDPEHRAERFFDMADVNHDGQISRAEFLAARQRMEAHRRERMARRAGGRGFMAPGYR